MGSTKRRPSGRPTDPSQALIDRPFAGRWSEEEAARIRQRRGLVIGPYVPKVDVTNPASVRAALANEPFGDLISDEAIEKSCLEGRAASLFSDRYPPGAME